MGLLSLTVVGIAAATLLGAVLGERFGMLRGRWTLLLRGAGIVMLVVIGFGVLRNEQGGLAAGVLLLLICAAELLGDRAERLGCEGATKRLRSLLTVGVIALHHFPEGMAAGLSCMTDGAASYAVCAAVVLHSIPETMVIPPTMQAAGFGRTWQYTAAAVSGAMEILGVLVGAFM